MISLYIRRILLSALVVASLPLAESFAQTQKSAADTLVPLHVIHRAGNLHNYVFTEKTLIHRKHSDSSEKNFEREVTYYISHVAPKPSENGFTTVQVLVDSMTYRFREGTFIIEYNSMRDATPNLKFLDLQYATVPLNRSFDMTVSSYGDIAEVKGEQIDWLRNYVTVEGKDIMAPIQKFIWLDGISDNNLKHFGDITKGIIPNSNTGRNSTWSHPVSLRINNIDFSGDVQANIASAQDGIFKIEAAADSLQVSTSTKETRLYGITDLVHLKPSSKASTKFSIELDGSNVRRVEADCMAVLDANVKNENFRDTISTKLSWTLTGQTQW